MAFLGEASLCVVRLKIYLQSPKYRPAANREVCFTVGLICGKEESWNIIFHWLFSSVDLGIGSWRGRPHLRTNKASSTLFVATGDTHTCRSHSCSSTPCAIWTWRWVGIPLYLLASPPKTQLCLDCKKLWRVPLSTSGLGFKFYVGVCSDGCSCYDSSSVG